LCGGVADVTSGFGGVSGLVQVGAQAADLVNGQWDQFVGSAAVRGVRV
jgi:hypothetical protein